MKIINEENNKHEWVENLAIVSYITGYCTLATLLLVQFIIRLIDIEPKWFSGLFQFAMIISIGVVGSFILQKIYKKSIKKNGDK